MDAEKDAVLPGYLRRVPPPFAVLNASNCAASPANDSRLAIRNCRVSVVAFGDFGTGEDSQKQVAGAMVAYQKAHPFDFGITMGDNFTPIGMASPDDPRWQTRWEDLYSPMKIKFYATLGNHDWSSPDSPAAELSYRSKTKSWAMPAPYYTYTAGPAQFFAIDTGVTGTMSLAQLEWLKARLNESKARWKIVYGHHCIYSARGESDLMVRELMPVLKGRADVYLAGHYHSLQHLRPVDGVNFYISAGGGRPLYPVDPVQPAALFAKSAYGFAAMEIDDRKFVLRFVGVDGKVLYESTVTK
jgi:hypothetical protein